MHLMMYNSRLDLVFMKYISQTFMCQHALLLSTNRPSLGSMLDNLTRSNGSNQVFKFFFLYLIEP